MTAVSRKEGISIIACGFGLVAIFVLCTPKQTSPFVKPKPKPKPKQSSPLVKLKPIQSSQFVKPKPKQSSPLVEPKPMCSEGFIRKYSAEHKYFPTGGTWFKSAFQPDTCRFQFKTFPANNLRACLGRRNVTKLTILGDSNGWRYFLGAQRLLENIMKCHVIKQAHLSTLPDAVYFTKGTRLNAADIVVHHRDCNGCFCRLISCTDGTMTVQVEYIVMEFFLDTEVTTVRNRWQKNCRTNKVTKMCGQSNTNQEFIFGEYLKGNYPDVILLFSPSHDKARGGLIKVRSDIEYLKMIINMYVPARTKLVWFSKISECQRMKPNIWKNVTYGEKIKTNEQLVRLNRALFDVIQPEFTTADSKIVPFFDIHDMSLGVPHWSTDGMHRKPEWYDVVLSNWFQTFCQNSK